MAPTGVYPNAASKPQIRTVTASGLPPDVVAMSAAKLESALFGAVGARP